MRKIQITVLDTAYPGPKTNNPGPDKKPEIREIDEDDEDDNPLFEEDEMIESFEEFEEDDFEINDKLSDVKDICEYMAAS